VELSDNQNTATVEGVQYSNDGTVTLDLSNKKKLKLALEKWSELGQPLNKMLSYKEQKVLEQESCCTLIRNKMLSLLARREHSAEELRRKLKQSSSILKTVDSSDLLERCLQEMQEKGFQSDDRFARQYVESKLANKSHGPLKILAELFNRGIPREQANLVLNELGDQELWLKKSIECLEKFQKKGKTLTPQTLSQKLYQKGFTWETIEKAVEIFHGMENFPDE
jgi:regulatory protein